MDVPGFIRALRAVEGFVGADVVESRGRQHAVLATTQPTASITDYGTPSCEPIVKFAERYGIHASVLPFATEHGVSYDIVMRKCA